MRIQRKPFIKWSVITVICGAPSFFFGWMATDGALLPMLLGMLTLILALSYVDSQPFYQNKRASKPTMAKALDWSVRLRIGFAIYVLLALLLQEMVRIRGPFEILWVAPMIVEGLIGFGAISLTEMLTSVKLTGNMAKIGPDTLFIATYLTTVFTAFAHTLILGVISGLVYLFLRLKRTLSKQKNA